MTTISPCHRHHPLWLCSLTCHVFGSCSTRSGPGNWSPGNRGHYSTALDCTPPGRRWESRAVLVIAFGNPRVRMIGCLLRKTQLETLIGLLHRRTNWAGSHSERSILKWLELGLALIEQASGCVNHFSAHTSTLWLVLAMDSGYNNEVRACEQDSTWNGDNS